MTAFFAIIAIVSFLAVLPIAAQMDSHRRGLRETAYFFMGAALTLFIVGIAGCIFSQSN